LNVEPRALNNVPARAANSRARKEAPVKGSFRWTWRGALAIGGAYALLQHGRLLGRLGYLRLPRWANDGHADYVARDIDLGRALQGLKSGARELDPARSGLYVTYQLMVAYLVDKKRIEPRALLEHPGDRDRIERELVALPSW